jgi:hypothetical protein
MIECKNVVLKNIFLQTWAFKSHFFSKKQMHKIICL